MNRSSRKARANASPSGSRLRQLLRAIADAGQPSATGLQLFVGPNGALMWTEAPQVDRSEPCADTVLAIPEKLTAPVNHQSPVTTHPEQPVGSPVYPPLEAPAQT
jgi:hypothetical protein